MAFAFASCQQYEHGYYTAYRHMANEDLDLIVHVGDYIYEYTTGEYTSTGGNVRGHSNHEVISLADYRERHAQYKTDPDLQAAHASAPWLVTFDGHEVDNNWANDVPQDGMPRDAFLQRRAAAFRAYWEHMPLRRTARPVGSAIQVFMAQQDMTTGAGESYNMDAWDGYRASRDRLLSFIDTHNIANPIVITGDVHANWAADLLADFSNPGSKVLGSEFIGTSISTTGDGSDTSTTARLTENPWIKFNNRQRGYVKVSLDQIECRGDFRVVPYVKRPGAPISTRKSFVIEAGHPGLQNA
jgi:alkaline phosphatase D